MNKIRIGIVGYGNLGKGVAMAVEQNPDMELVSIFTRRNPQNIDTTYTVSSTDEILSYRGKIDVMILCGGSAKDIPEQIGSIATLFNTVDSFDTHAAIPEYFKKVDAISRANDTLSLISTGWDPGLFSMMRLLGETILPQGETYTFWGKGLSQGHSDAIRRVSGVKNGVQYTIPKPDAIQSVREGHSPNLSAAQRHERVCFVVPEENADRAQIEHDIKTMPHYFDQYQTTVHFIDEETLQNEHSAMPHGGVVIRTGQSKIGSKQRMEFSLALDSNPQFTSSVLVAYARAVYRLSQQGQVGCVTVFDIPLTYLSPKKPEKLRKELL